MSAPIFVVTDEDLGRLDAEAFDAVWAALGLVVLARVGKARPVSTIEAREADAPVTDVAPVVSEGSPPAGVATSPEPNPKLRTCQDCGMIVRGGVGLSSHRRAAHPAKDTAPEPVRLGPARKDFDAAAKAAASRTWAERVEQTA